MFFKEIDGETVACDQYGFRLGHSVHEEMTEAIRLLTEAKAQAAADLCGDHRAFLLPRLDRAWLLIVRSFPACAAHPDGMRAARDAWGDPVMEPTDGPR